MTRSARAAGMIMGGVSDPSFLSPYARAGIRAYLFPGSLLREPEKLASMVSAARRAAESAGLGPALVAVGGGGTPAFGPPPFPRSPTPLGLASLKSAKASRRAGLLMGYSLASCGVDMVLAPRLDLASDPKVPTGVLEGFGEDGRLAGILGTAFIRGLAGMGVRACVGRFPGLGAICHDCNECMAFIALPVERLERCEMRPFAHVVASGVAAVLMGRVLVPALESEHLPASASARVIEGRLRESLGFRGIVIGDDIGPDEEPGKAAVLGALAGCDLCLCSRPDAALAAAAALEKAAASGELPTVRIEVGRRRLDALLSEGPPSPPRPSFLSAGRLRDARRDIEESVSVLRGSLALEGAGSGAFASAFILVFMPPTDAPDRFESEAVLTALRSELPGANILGLPAESEPKATDELARALAPRGRYTEAAVLTYDAHFRPAQEGLARLVEEFIPKFRVIAMRDPYDAAFFPDAVGLAAAYGFSEGSAQAVGRILSGKFTAQGSHPVEVIGLEI